GQPGLPGAGARHRRGDRRHVPHLRRPGRQRAHILRRAGHAHHGVHRRRRRGGRRAQRRADRGRAAGAARRPVRGGGVIAAIGPDQAWAYYLTLGMVATVNPCGFAMLPAYLSFFLGLEDSDAEVPTAGVARALRVSVAVAAGFLAVFAVAGTAVRLTSLPVYETVPWISIVIGLALLV